MPNPWDKDPVVEDKKSSAESAPWEKDEEVAPEAPVGLTPGSANSDSVGRFVGNFADAINPFPGIAAIASDPQGLKHGIEQNVFKPQVDEFGKAGDAIKGRGEASTMNPLERGSSAFGHALAGAIPLIGPSAANAGEQIGSGDIAGGLGSGAGLIANVAAAPRVNGLIGKGLRGAAEPIAETSLGIRNVDRAPAKEPGRAALDQTSGLSPEKVRASAGDAITKRVGDRTAAFAASPSQVDIRPAVDEINASIAKATAGNSDPSHLIPMRDQLTTPKPGFAGATTPAPLNSGPIRISDLQSPNDALAIRQRFGNDYTKFDHARPLSNETLNVGNRAYGKITDAIHSAVPESAAADRDISNLIPVRDSAKVRSLEAPTWQQTMARVAKPTGALIGAATGYHEAGIPGAVAGLILPELLSSPSAQMGLARTINGAGNVMRNPVGGRLISSPSLIKPRGDQQ